MLKFIVSAWFLALLVDGFGSPLVGLYFWRMRAVVEGKREKIKMARAMALLMYGSSLEAWAILFSLYMDPDPPYKGAVIPIAIRLIFRIIKTIPLFFVLAEIIPKPKEE